MTSPTATAPASAPTPTADAPSVRGWFLWYDLVTPDVTAASRFYGAVLGWTVTLWNGDGGQPYLMWTNRGTPLGGVVPMPDDEATRGRPGYWMPYVGTTDVDAAWAEAMALGARELHAPADIPTVGRIAIVMDPQGAAFALFRPAPPGVPTAGVAEVGAFSWHELETSDHAAALAFYGRLVGWGPTESMDMGAHGTYQMYGHAGTTHGGMFDRMDPATPPHWMPYVRVADLEAALDAVRLGGGTVLNGPMEVPGGDRVAQCLDPQGAPFGLHAVTAPAAG